MSMNFVEIMQQTWKTLKKEKPYFTFPFSCIQAEHWPGYESSKCQEESIIKRLCSMLLFKTPMSVHESLDQLLA